MTDRANTVQRHASKTAKALAKLVEIEALERDLFEVDDDEAFDMHETMQRYAHAHNDF